MWLVFSLLSAITAAAVAIFAKLGLKNIDITLATTIRSIIMALFLVLTSILFGKFRGFNFQALGSREWTLIVLAGVSGALSWLFYFFALKVGMATKVASIDRLSLIFVIILASLFLGEALTWRTVLGALIIVSGALIINLK
ncbi:MAG: EamA family transporter [Patescibacteria group bacterium]